MSKIVYSHRMQGILQQVVVDLGLALTLSDKGSDVQLAENEKMFSDLAMMMNVEFKRDQANGVTIFTFRRKR
ncbi:MAG: hypothetical protein AAGB10_11355 [Pseudomonadota bacterium]